MQQPGSRIGVFGGTFDPPHIGHLAVAATCRDALNLDRLLLVVAGEPWQKVDDRSVTPAATRLELTEAAVRPYAGLECSDLEVRRTGPTYTVDTLEELRDAEPSAELVLVLGADAARGLPTWHRPDDVADLATMVVCDRTGDADGLPAEVDWVHVAVPRIDVSSSGLRRALADGRRPEVLIPPGPLQIIEDRGLYRERR